MQISEGMPLPLHGEGSVIPWRGIGTGSPVRSAAATTTPTVISFEENLVHSM